MKEIVGILFVILLVFLSIAFSVHLILYGMSFGVMAVYITLMVASVVGIFSFDYATNGT